MSSLKRYHSLRDPGSTPEPFTASRRTGGKLFIVHHHAARSAHYDLRLEVRGALWSWAVPKGPSPNPNDKRLAVHVESHPVDYGFFEGVIPDGNYGAGPTIIWDRGRWDPIIDPEQGLDDGKLLFELHGYKLHGRWTLVRTKQNWLLIKERDGFTRVESTESFAPDSVLSGLTVDELRNPARRVAKLSRSLAARKAPNAQPPAAIEPMLCTLGEPAEHAGWLYELKYDGIRMIAHKHAGEIVLRSRSGRSIGDNFPELTETLAHLPYSSFVLDGEIVVEGAKGLPSFQRLMKRSQLTRAADVERATIMLPAVYYAFDLLFAEGRDLRALTLEQRKQVLKTMLPSTGAVRFADHLERDGPAMWQRCAEMELEGVVAKQKNSQYVSTRSASWQKWPVYQTDAFSVIGLRAGRSNANDVGAVHLAERVDGDWVYRGRAGSGLDQRTREALAQLTSDAWRERPVVDVPETSDADTWLRPRLTATIRYLRLTDSGQLRQPVVLSLGEQAQALHEPTVATVEPDVERRVVFSNQDKIFWPERGHSKGDLIGYYRAISKWMLPWLADRPVVLTRYPDGIHGKSFFQHNAPAFAPAWVRRETIIDPADASEKTYFIIDSEDALLYLANLGTIPIHMWSSRLGDLDRPDYCVLDLDPKDAPFERVIKAARELHGLCNEVGLECYVKTTGKSGLHVLIPLDGEVDHAGSRTLAELLARLVVQRAPDVATVTRSVSRRGGKVYLDYLQNGLGKTIAAPFCAREVEHAGVSMPLSWREVNRGLDPTRYRIDSAPARMRRRRDDPCLAALGDAVDLVGAMAALTERMPSAGAS